MHGNETPLHLTPRARDSRKQRSWLRSPRVVRSNHFDRRACCPVGPLVTSHQARLSERKGVAYVINDVIDSGFDRTPSGPRRKFTWKIWHVCGSRPGSSTSSGSEAHPLGKIVFEPMLDCKHSNIASGATPIGSAAAHPIDQAPEGPSGRPGRSTID